MNSGVPKSAKARMNTISMAAMMVGAHRGMITVKNRLTPVQPMFSLASSRVLSTFFKAPDTYRNTSGYNCRQSTSRIPPKP